MLGQIPPNAGFSLRYERNQKPSESIIMPTQPPPGVPFPADGQLPETALTQLRDRPLSLYLHVPFCRIRCGYCDFNTYTPSELPGMTTTSYLSSAHEELKLAAQVLGDQTPPIDTIFFGGGTPTMLPAGDLVELRRRITELFPVAKDVEVTTEANPETVDPQYFDELRQGGFTRISLGMQSVVPHVLATLERSHTPERGLQAATWAALAGFTHISLDLIFGTPGETLDDWRQSLAAVTSTPADHVSAYSLIVEPGTRLALQVKRGRVPMPDDDDLAVKYELADEFLESASFTNYETSNWAKYPQSRCRHNLHYWRGDNWWGIGPGAHSHIAGVRFWNRKHPRSWADRLKAGQSPVLAGEYLSPAARRMERVMLELRLAEGLNIDVLTATEQGRIADLEARGVARMRNNHIILTKAGRLLADGVVRDLLDA